MESDTFTVIVPDYLQHTTLAAWMDTLSFLAEEGQKKTFPIPRYHLKTRNNCGNIPNDAADAAIIAEITQTFPVEDPGTILSIDPGTRNCGIILMESETKMVYQHFTMDLVGLLGFTNEKKSQGSSWKRILGSTSWSIDRQNP